MFHYIYKITFLQGPHKNSYYIGKRTSEVSPETDNRYKGSGNYCKSYYAKYGTNNTYTKEILEITDSPQANADAEKK